VGHCEIVVIDSETLSAAQGMLVRVAARACAEEESLEDVIRIVRGTIERVYAMFYVDSINTLLPEHKIMSPSHTILGAMLGVKPCLALEDGLLRPIEKVRTRTQAIDRLIEFVVEFTDIDEMVILQNRTYPTDQTQVLQDRLLLEFPGQHFPYAQYGPSLTALIGPDVIGIVLMESEMEYLGDGYTKDTFRD
jgi:DegV family protein with EDD domain